MVVFLKKNFSKQLLVEHLNFYEFFFNKQLRFQVGPTNLTTGLYSDLKREDKRKEINPRPSTEPKPTVLEVERPKTSHNRPFMYCIRTVFLSLEGRIHFPQFYEN